MAEAAAPLKASWTGGCQCGAIRYALAVEPTGRSVCHCRMCQKASGGPFMVFGRVPIDKIEWTSGAPSVFRSSTLAERGFCKACGTPLTYQWRPEAISITLGSLDQPASVSPDEQLGIESRLPWMATLDALHSERADDWLKSKNLDGITSYQHPDHEI